MSATKSKNKYLNFTFKRRHFRFLLDKVLIFRFMRKLHGRFWGVSGLSFMIVGFGVCFAIRPDLLTLSTAFSDFGNDVRTAPYFAGSVFVAAYGMWRWRNYLSRTWKRTMPVTGLITLTIMGLYLVALMPVSWGRVPHRIHMIGFGLTGVSMLLTVVMDSILSKGRRSQRQGQWRVVTITSFVLIVVGGWLTLGSAELVGWYNIALLGESLMLAGYLLWVSVKTYQGEGSRSTLSKLLKNIVLID